MWKRILPWLVSFGLLGYLAWTTDLERVVEAFQQAPMGRFFAIAVISTLLAFFYDTFCLTLVLRRFNAPVGYREMLPLKGASYLLNIINYNAAMGGMALYLKRVRGVSFLESASSLLFLNVLDVFVLCGLIGVGLLVGGEALDVALDDTARRGLLFVVGGFGALLVGNWIYWNGRFDYFILGRLRYWRIFHAFQRAKVVDYAWIMGLRVFMILLYVAVMWMFTGVFGMEVPFRVIIVLQPIIIFVGTVPITVAGLGTTQVVMRSFYGVFATYLGFQTLAPPLLASAGGIAGSVAGAVGAAAGVDAAAAAYFDPTPLVDALSTTAIFSVVLVRIGIGYACLEPVSRRIAETSAAPAASSAVDSGEAIEHTR